MSDHQFERDRELARTVVRDGLSALVSAKDVVKQQIEKLCVLSEKESQGFDALRMRIAAYTKLETPEHPLCLGVFGPPGSGKSFAVKQVFKSMGHELCVINLSQLQGPADLSAALADLPQLKAGQMPVVFFDEFDSGLAGTPLGWLQWLLAPMQDGVVFHPGKPIELKRAVFVFAGGTSDSFEEFPDAHVGYFRGAKGPDFVSRLRSYVNVSGVNEWPYRRVRRATVLRLAIERVASGLLDEKGVVAIKSMPDEFIDQVVSVGRFVHGSRSVEALVEMATFPNSKEFTEKDLPAPEVLLGHVDPGPLGGLSIALSAGGDRREGDTGHYDEGLEDVWTGVATRLLELGAGLVYAGDLRPGGFTTHIAEAYARLPNPLGQPVKSDVHRFARPRPARVVCFRSDKDSRLSQEPPFDRIDVRPLPGLEETELAELGETSNAELTLVNPSPVPVSDWKTSPDWCKRLGRALALFRLRAQVTRLADAHLLFGGREYGSSGRFPGVAEELMLSLSAGNAVYLCGGFAGAARAVGELLGLGSPWFGVPNCLRSEKHGTCAATLEAAVKDWGKRFQLPHRNSLPLDYEELVRFLRSHAIDGPRWPGNGLTADENRTLFRSKDAKEITRLVTKGLRLRFGGDR